MDDAVSGSVDPELLDEVRRVVAGIESVSELPAREARRVREHVATAFVANRDAGWWWDALAMPARRLDATRERASLFMKLRERYDDDVILVVTDDAFPPWPAFRGAVGDIIDVIEACRGFEYHLVDRDVTWVLFENHSDQMIVVGLTEWLDDSSSPSGGA